MRYVHTIHTAYVQRYVEWQRTTATAVRMSVAFPQNPLTHVCLHRKANPHTHTLHYYIRQHGTQNGAGPNCSLFLSIDAVRINDVHQRRINVLINDLRTAGYSTFSTQSVHTNTDRST